ncbi:MAG: hypothetical protein U0X75_16815 [Acidobacteriota bacterium]
MLKREGGHHEETEGRMTLLYRRVMGNLIRVPKWLWLFADGDGAAFGVGVAVRLQSRAREDAAL